MEMGTQDVVFFEVDRDRWSDMERLFEGRGGPKNCWCMVWRGSTKDRFDKTTRKAAMSKLVNENVPVGLLGYLGDEPIAWISIAPRSTFRDLGGINHHDGKSENVWSVVCFYVVRKFRGLGLMNRLIHEAVVHARRKGATVLEAYPVDADSPSYRFMGFVSF